MAYRANVTDKEQSDLERAADHSAIRFPSFDVATDAGEMKSIRAYDLQAQADAGGSPSSAVALNSRDRLVIGSHNDKAHRFATPGKA
jgi:hypothetical protein